jgi:hypothetical protein
MICIETEACKGGCTGCTLLKAVLSIWYTTFVLNKPPSLNSPVVVPGHYSSVPLPSLWLCLTTQQ